ETRKAPPHQPRGRLDQRRGPPIADDGEVQAMVGHAAIPAPLEIFSSQSRTSRGVSKRLATPGTARPTEIGSPCNSGMAANAVSSVVSSPMKIGRRPAKAG